MMDKRIINFVLLLVFCLSCTFAKAQDIQYINKVYSPDIETVTFYIEGQPTSEPILNIRSDARLILGFDDMLGGDYGYTYSIIHCTKDWKPSNITEIDYLEGFNNEMIDNYDYSVGTRDDYTHYQLALPNDDTGWKISGNYLLIIRDEDKNPVITRRFMITEQLVLVEGTITRSRKASRLQREQELHIAINPQRYNIQNPTTELSISIMQNGRWDNALSDISPVSQVGGIINFDRTRPLSFTAYNEFRGVDARSTIVLGHGIEFVDVAKEETNLYMFADLKRQERIRVGIFPDMNGSFVIEKTENTTVSPSVSLIDAAIANRAGEYVHLNFALYADEPLPDSDVYVIGAFNNWEPSERYRMTYDKKDRLYLAKILVKQGYYDYQYLAVKDDGSRDIEVFEGSFFGTENDYDVLVYQRTFGGLYDRLIAAQRLTSRF